SRGRRPLAVHALLNHGADPLLYDYSGNMPIDLTEEDLDMRKYLGGILSDLHGKTAPRWNVVSRGSRNSFSTPPQELTQECDEDESLSLEFECSSSPLPPYYQFKDREGQFVKASDLPAYLLKGATLLEMTKEEFLRNSHCTLLGGGSSPTEKDSKNVRLLRLDESLRKALGISIETLS
ncbi:Putative LOC100877383, partial [Caligus rogercresseyi]